MDLLLIAFDLPLTCFETTFPMVPSAWPLSWMTAIRRRNTDRHSDEEPWPPRVEGKLAAEDITSPLNLTPRVNRWVD